ncbi:MAG: DegT/DnrJ/EryC1/StrS family aminotransferase [Candidatus Protochlamydia sp.]|nr:DegT/DnrJ/EryC1/StrS family aminotransferase [Candidatus Protochlamydia sp.]
MPPSFLPYAKQSIHPNDIAAVATALNEELITRGPPVKAFEEAIAKYCGASYAVAFSNGTAALMAAYFAADLNPFDRVVSTPNTFIASVGIPVRLGTPISFVDIDCQTGNMNLERLKALIQIPSSRGRPFVIPVHFAGIALDMVALNHSLSHPDVIIIEDAAHAIGSYYPSGERVGCCAYSDMTIFSFHPAKTMTTGEGGMVTTNNPEYHRRLLLYRDNGIVREAGGVNIPGYYEVQEITGNFHLTSFQGALGLSQLERLEDFIKKRRQLVKIYRSNLKNIPHLRLFTDEFDAQTAFHLMVVQIDFSKYETKREIVMESLKRNGIGTQVHYIPLYRHPVLKHSLDWEEKYPETEHYYSKALSLPLYFDLTENDVERVCKVLESILKNK